MKITDRLVRSEEKKTKNKKIIIKFWLFKDYWRGKTVFSVWTFMSTAFAELKLSGLRLCRDTGPPPVE